MKLPVITTEHHEGKVLEINADQEVVTLYSAAENYSAPYRGEQS